MPEIFENTMVTKNIPNLQVGDTVEIRPWAELQRENYLGLIDCGWNTDMRSLSGKRFQITDRMYSDFISYPATSLINIRGWEISASMVKVVDDSSEQEQNLEDDMGYSLRNEWQDENIIKEMIDKVDRTRFKKLLCVASCDNTVTVENISDSIIDKYLNAWASAKYDIYLLFGKQLGISKQIKAEIDSELITNKIVDMQIEFPQYANLLGSFSSFEFIENKCNGTNATLKKVYSRYKNDAKLSKVLAGLVKDKSFNDALAMLFSNMTIDATLKLSIDPFDYLTMSVNRYSWETCQRIGDIDAPYGTGAGSVMLDESTIIAFAHSGKDVMYHMHGMEFSGNSKFWRQCMYIDKDSGNFVASREYPDEKELVSKEARIMLEDTIAAYLNIQSQWTVASGGTINYNEGSQNLYHDVSEGKPYKDVKIKGSNKKTTVTVGNDIFCVKCGRIIQEHFGRYVCDYDFEYSNSFRDTSEPEEAEVPF